MENEIAITGKNSLMAMRISYPIIIMFLLVGISIIPFEGETIIPLLLFSLLAIFLTYLLVKAKKMWADAEGIHTQKQTIP